MNEFAYLMLGKPYPVPQHRVEVIMDKPKKPISAKKSVALMAALNRAFVTHQARKDKNKNAVLEAIRNTKKGGAFSADLSVTVQLSPDYVRRIVKQLRDEGFIYGEKDKNEVQLPIRWRAVEWKTNAVSGM